MEKRNGENQKKLTPNQIKGLHPAVRTEFVKKNITASQARTANRLVRQPYNFKSRIALRTVLEKVDDTGIASLRGILNAMPVDAPAQLLEAISFAILRGDRVLDEAVREVEEAAAGFREKRKALESRPKPPRATRPNTDGKTSARRKSDREWKKKRMKWEAPKAPKSD